MIFTVLPLSGSAFSRPVYALDTSGVTDSAITDEAIVPETGDQNITENDTEEDLNDSVDKDDTSSEKKTAEAEVITTSAPVRNTDLVTNPYRGYSYARLMKEIRKLKSRYPEIIQTGYIGKTAAGRNIPLVKLGNGKKKILIVGTEHAREYVSTSLIMRSIDTYSRAYILDKKIDGTRVKSVLNKVTFYFVPMLNIDGAQIVMGAATSKDKSMAKRYTGTLHYYRYRNMWKANARGVDLNRNYPFRWSKGENTKRRAYMEFKGRKQASEPEVKSIVNLCKNNSFAYMFTMHTRGQIIYWKDKYNDVVPGASTLAGKVRSITGYRSMPTSSWESCSGESAKWFRSVYNKPAFTIEMSPNTISYKSVVKKKYFDKYIWKKNRSLFLRTALTTTPSNKFKVYFSPGKGTVSKRYISIKTGRSYGDLPKAKRKGYKFRGWFTSGGVRITSKSIATQKRNITIYAKYKKK